MPSRHLELDSWIKYQLLTKMGKPYFYLFDHYNIDCFSINFSDVIGVITLTNLSSKMLRGSVKKNDSVMKALYKQFEMVGQDISIHYAFFLPLHLF